MLLEMGLLCLLEMGIWGDGYLMEFAEDGILECVGDKETNKFFFYIGWEETAVIILIIRQVVGSTKKVIKWTYEKRDTVLSYEPN